MARAFHGVLPDGVTVTHSARRYVQEWRAAAKAVCAALDAADHDPAVRWQMYAYEPGMSVHPTWSTGDGSPSRVGGEVDLPPIAMRALLRLAKGARRGR